MASNISVLAFGDIMKPLVARFSYKKMTEEQVDIYYDHLKFQPENVLKEAVRSLVLEAQHFPTPREFSNACLTVSRGMDKGGSAQHQIRSSCRFCREGYIKFAYQYYRKDGSFYTKYESRPCAHCNTEPNGMPHYTQAGDKILMAARRLPSGMWVPDLAHQEWQQDYTPTFSADALAEYYAEERAGKTTRMNVVNKVVDMRDFKFPERPSFNPDELPY